ncbi:DEHA2F18964p [Debaryomyces hansenii CBS767]|uniref:Ataxin-10 homolog n=1 Tax=Debaryomyces hansenii (strain ATCC 36239 / CBS 767 / BCRC 21394 / JCM 1990 / NBRC 0083 / IGC 2968) TaxID=284592 RepID=ATX10_DEBHA|nr:DEHA2F18964p [Debaryomyces hansenii CBS767]Q6BKV2.2 RecName: Full=Copper transport protein 86 [Debaryomyces hansenii CBS767]CAR66370.1 DEHA2F18964p [Debaryomyces hansenii CBS767]|eukprot:XP_002770849.1 DEHA2F18964p [Debaryomyces hansenii CBS767]
MMEEELYKSVIVTAKSVRSVLLEETSNVEDCQKNLNALGQIVSASSQSQEYRSQILANNGLPDVLVEILNRSFQDNVPTEELKFTLYIRLMRGILLLARNLVITKQFVEFSSILSSLENFNQKVSHNNEFYSKTLVVYIQFLANMSQITREQNIVAEIVETFFKNEDLMSLIANDDQMKMPFAAFLKNILSNSDNLYDVLTHDDTILRYTISELDKADIHNEDLDQYSSLLILTFQNIIAHETYSKWLKRIDCESAEFSRIMKLNQVIVTSKEDWDNYQLTAMLAWIFDNFLVFSEISKSILLSSIYDPLELKRVHLNLIILLDCLSDLGKFEATKQFLEHYNAIEELISLLRVVHESVDRKTLKNKEKIEETVGKKEFPQVKSLIIEVIAFLVHGSFEIQEKMRELHGLELVLSNCMIDDNDPFIKERAIVCVKFLLANNEKNQQFVADLEAKQTVDDDALKEVGYEVQIEDGNVKLRKTENQKLQEI